MVGSVAHLPPLPPQQLPPTPAERQQQHAQQQPREPPVQAQCLAAEVAVGRGAARLLAWVPGSDLAVAAAGSCLLLLRCTAAAVQPLAVLLECSAGITAVAVSSVSGEERQWAAALEGGAGGTAHFVPIDSSGVDAACYGGPSPGAGAQATTASTAPGAPGWAAAAWHPSEPVCALLAPHELLLVGPSGLEASSGSHAGGSRAPDGGGSTSGSEDEGADSGSGGGAWRGTLRSGQFPAGPRSTSTHKGSTWGSTLRGGDWGSLSGGTTASVLLALPGPASGAAGAAAGRCCLAWLHNSGGSAGARSPGGSAGDGALGAGCRRQLVVSWGGHLELLCFGEGWQLRERRQLLPGLPGPVCALSAAGGDRLLAATERPLAQWIGAAASSERPEQLRPGVLQRGLTAARRPSGPVLHPTLTWPAAGRPTGPPAGLLWPAEGPETEPPPLSAPAEAGDGVIDLTSAPWAARAGGSEHGSNPFLAPQVAAEQQQQQAAAPAIPSMLMLTTPTHMPLAEGLSLLPSLPPQQQPLRQGAAAAAAAAGGGGSSADGGGRGAAVEGGHATLLWLDPPLCAGPGGGGLGHRRTASWSPPGVGGVSSPREPALELALAADLAETCGGYTVLASSRAAPVLAVCRLGSQGLQQVAAVPLAAPSGVPDSCTVRIRGLTVGPAAEGGGSGLAVWALLAAAQLGAAAPFLSAALSSRIYGSSKQQLWLCCYHLQLPGRGAALSPVLSRMGSSLAVEPSALAAQAAAAAAEQPTVAAADAMSQAAASEAGASGAAPAVGGPAAAAAAAVAAEAATGEAPAAAAAPLTPEPGSVPRSPPSATAAPAAGAAAAAAVGSTSAAEAAPAPLPAAAAPLPGGQAAVDAVLALQRAVEGLRQEVNTRLDTLDADLSELLQTLRLPPTDGDAA